VCGKTTILTRVFNNDWMNVIVCCYCFFVRESAAIPRRRIAQGLTMEEIEALSDDLPPITMTDILCLAQDRQLRLRCCSVTNVGVLSLGRNFKPSVSVMQVSLHCAFKI
jgi:hypothetical protein